MLDLRRAQRLYMKNYDVCVDMPAFRNTALYSCCALYAACSECNMHLDLENNVSRGGCLLLGVITPHEPGTLGGTLWLLSYHEHCAFE